ncbi:GPALPP motifs-containing protein 1 [Wyeomyia smithii]|uniref:GPALPP motifs-containing protein 1 n=1 Tax=Wyeomyia smithii TaxID=174621 RepID=UPI002467F141|nr:GPALPP motifs-containing protein 1 [Wyeomyia smithii]XP_055541063.1 GPALPP motifs-containing protein 1 [Wyeomyia smithii]
MSDTDTSDSDSGIRFKTTSTRYKPKNTSKCSVSTLSKHSRSPHGHRSRSLGDRERDRDDRQKKRKSRHRSRSRENRQQTKADIPRNRSRSRSKTKQNRSRREEKSSLKTVPNMIHKNQELRSSMKQSDTVKQTDSGVSILSLLSQEHHLEKNDLSDICFGPALPPALLNKECITRDKNTDDDRPAHSQLYSAEVRENSQSDKFNIIGPVLPAHLKINTASENSESDLSPFSEEETHDEDDIIGPMPGTSNSKSNVELEQRALELKLKRLDEPTDQPITTREDWMLQLPDIRKVSDMGLGARQFRTREKLEIGDRSVWTDTPNDKERKKLSHGSSKNAVCMHEDQTRRKTAERDKQQEEMIKKHKKHKRDKSLLDTHQQKLEKTKKKQNNSEAVRRPFDRNIDLHANRFDEAQKKAIFKKAKLLETRFSSGASKFL